MKYLQIYRSYLIPVCVYQSVTIAGGYGTGREVVEFFTRHGVYGGIYGLLLAGIAVALLSAFTFEIARQVKAYDYRSFFKTLIGPFWVVFEILYLCLLLLVLAVVGSAAGSMIAEHTVIPEAFGIVIMLSVIALLIFFGRELVENVMVFLSLFLFSAFFLYFFIVLSGNWITIKSQLHTSAMMIDTAWFGPALKFAIYQSPAAAFVLFATRGIVTRTEALGSGALCGFVFILPGLMFHLSFLGFLPDITAQPVPVHWLINQMDSKLLSTFYLIAMFGTFLGTGAGFIQAVNERLDSWSMEKFGHVLSPSTHSGVAITGIALSVLLGQLGVITLIAKGYGSLAWGFLLVFVIPVMWAGVKRVILKQKIVAIAA